jgi:putative (di)nucleoside polyphosphate hydrolase
MTRKAVCGIVFNEEMVLLVNKTKINTFNGQEAIKGEWDFIKGGVQETDRNLLDALLRELKEETGSSDFQIVRQFEEKLCFTFPDHIQSKIGYIDQETTMFQVEYVGNVENLHPLDNEIINLKFINKTTILDYLSHEETKDFFIRHFENRKPES